MAVILCPYIITTDNKSSAGFNIISDRKQIPDLISLMITIDWGFPISKDNK